MTPDIAEPILFLLNVRRHDSSVKCNDTKFALLAQAVAESTRKKKQTPYTGYITMLTIQILFLLDLEHVAVPRLTGEKGSTSFPIICHLQVLRRSLRGDVTFGERSRQSHVLSPCYPYSRACERRSVI